MRNNKITVTLSDDERAALLSIAAANDRSVSWVVGKLAMTVHRYLEFCDTTEPTELIGTIMETFPAEVVASNRKA